MSNVGATSLKQQALAAQTAIRAQNTQVARQSNDWLVISRPQFVTFELCNSFFPMCCIVQVNVWFSHRLAWFAVQIRQTPTIDQIWAVGKLGAVILERLVGCGPCEHVLEDDNQDSTSLPHWQYDGNQCGTDQQKESKNDPQPALHNGVWLMI